jgi:alkanesulfonate monooxygenase SsuD/methylene tetrahydromethanopterin reductase-like flavin-dependent oxidoreductase (luciferase family)
MPLLAGETVQFAGEHYNVNGVRLTVPGQPVVPTLIAALGPIMLNLAGAMADGTITWMTGEKTLETHIIPKINESAEKAGRKTPRVVAGFPILLTDKVAETRARIDQSLAIYGTLPSYRAMLDKEGLKGPGDLAIVGDETEVRARLTALRAIGVTDFTAAIAAENAEDAARTRAFLASEC